MFSIDLQALERWCQRRRLTWTVANQSGPASAIVLAPQETGRVWQRTLLVLSEPERRLENEAGDVLAIASDVAALLDAVDGGVADAPASTAASMPQDLAA